MSEPKTRKSRGALNAELRELRYDVVRLREALTEMAHRLARAEERAATGGMDTVTVTAEEWRRINDEATAAALKLKSQREALLQLRAENRDLRTALGVRTHNSETEGPLT